MHNSSNEIDSPTSNISSGIGSDLTMITQEKNHNDTVTIHIIKDSEMWVVDVYRNQVISDLINMSIAHFLDPAESLNTNIKYKFISVTKKKVLNLQSTVSEEEIQNREEIVLVPIFPCGPKQKKLSLDDIKGPSQEEITNATGKLISKNPVQMIPSLHCGQDNLQSEIREVLYVLVEASAKILAARPDAKEVFDGIISRINSQIKKEVDKNALKYLKDLGFTEFQAKYALRLKKNRQIEAMEWLLENHSLIKEVKDEPAKLDPTTSNISDINSPLHMIKQLLEDIEDYHHQYFSPNSRAMENLTSMGFEPADVFEALKATNNNQVDACEWLCGEWDSHTTKPSVKLDANGQFYKALMDNPAIQLGLYKPKIMLAFLLILENPANANMWMNDIDTAPVLGQVFKIYHSEKHIMIVNQQIEMMKKRQTQS